MLRITVNKSAAAAKKYYSEHYYSEGKSLDDYYSEKEQLIGTWGGKAAEKLGLDGDIRKSDFAALCDNQMPGTGDKLTPRNNKERRVGYDFTFDAGKSVSLAYTFGNDENKKQILDAFRQSVKETMTEIETNTQVRVRKNNQFDNAVTGNIAYGEFIHFTTRPVNGVPDPQLHAHCFVFNTTYDEQEQKWKAGEFGQVKQDAPYYEAVFHSHLTDKLQAAGYSIQKTDKGFELQGVARETIEKFSNRSKEIDELAEKQNITDEKQKSALGAKTREGKRITASPDEVISNWKNRLTQNETDTLKNLKAAPTDEKKKENSVAALNYSLDHHLERKSVATDKEILATAIKASIGQATPEQVNQAYQDNLSIIRVKENNQTYITTKEALQEENNLISKAYGFKGRFKPINESYQFKTETLTDEQKTAINHALTTTDGITIISGKAGTGKTTLMREVQTGIDEAGKKIFAFAPSAEASRMVQRKEGFENADTVAKLILDKDLQEKTKNQVIWVDEGGTLSNKQMNKIFDIAKEQNARIIITGDTKQHTSVERGDALRTLQQHAGISSITVSKIQRQQNEQYKQAVQFLSKADIEKGFNKLDKIGAIQEITDHQERIKTIAEDYYKSAYGKGKIANKEVLVVSPTHIEGEKLTEQIRNTLKERKIIGQDEKQFMTFRNLQLTAAEKEKTENYQAGNWLIFHQNIKGFKAGSKYEIAGTDAKDGAVMLRDNSGNVSPVSTEKASCYNVFAPKSTSLGKGDKIRITGNGKTNEGVHLFNGTLYQVSGFDKQGDIKLSNGTTLARDYGNFTSGYVMTSHASQGKTVDKIIISQSSISFRASSKEQFYVSVSRGRQAVSIYTDDKEDLLQAISKSSERKSAIELTSKQAVMDQAVEINRRGLMHQIRDKAVEAAQNIKAKFYKQQEINENELQRKTQSKDAGKGR